MKILILDYIDKIGKKGVEILNIDLMSKFWKLRYRDGLKFIDLSFRRFSETHSAQSSEKLFSRAPNRPSSSSLRRRFHPFLGWEVERGIALESVWTPVSWLSPPPPSTPVAAVDKRRATRDIWIPAMRYNASVVHPPRKRVRFRMSESRDAADTEMLSANAPIWPGNGRFSDRDSSDTIAVPRLAGAVSETSISSEILDIIL